MYDKIDVFMAKKIYKSEDTTSGFLQEPAVAYQRRKATNANGWNPNVPFHGTQEEWWDHFHRIEEGPFMTLEEYHQKFEAWRKDFLASRL